jgi:signal transduction histidine kinase/ActR/RegA family two-component response regulator
MDYLVVSHFLVDSYQRLENKHVQANAVRARNTLMSEVDKLNTKGSVWLARDGAYQHFSQNSSEFLKHLSASDFDFLGINLLAYVDHHGNVKSALYDKKDPAGELKAYSKYDLQLSRLARQLREGSVSAHSGFIRLEQQTFIFSAHTLLFSANASGTESGLLIMARELSPASLGQLAMAADLQLEFSQLENWTETEELRVRALDYHTIAGEFLLRDYQGEAILMARVINSRDMTVQAKELTAYLLALLFLIGVLIALASQIMVSRLVIRRVSRLRERVQLIARSGHAVDGKVELSGGDEITDLADEFNQMIATINKTQQQLEIERQNADAANQAKSEFLANMSHEIRTPMTAILGFADLLQNPGIDAQEMKNHVMTIRQNGKQLLNIINDILDLSKIEAGCMELNISDVDVSSLLESVIALMKVTSQQKGLSLTLEFLTAIPQKINTDPVRLRQILINLIGNAVKFTDKGYVRLAVKYVEQSREITFIVQDSGIGMSKEDLKQSFQAFNQADNSATRKYGGTGLGLAISRQFAAVLGGDLSGQSQAGKGSCFSLTIPLGIEQAVLKTVNTSPELSRSAALPANTMQVHAKLQGTVLLVEDNPVLQLLIGKLLSGFGLQVITVDNGRIACQRLLDDMLTVKLVFMDIHMPIMDGFSATRYLRQNAYAGVIVALTANTMAGDREQCLESGCDDYIGKPVDVDELYRVCRQVFHQGKNVLVAASS